MTESSSTAAGTAGTLPRLSLSPTNFSYELSAIKWTASSEFGTYRLYEQRRFRRACASAQSRQNLRCSLIQAVSQEEPSDRKPDPWPLWMAGHAQLKFVMKECSKTQIRLTGLKYERYSTNWLTYWQDVPYMSNIMTKPRYAILEQQRHRSATGFPTTWLVCLKTCAHIRPRRLKTVTWMD